MIKLKFDANPIVLHEPFLDANWVQVYDQNGNVIQVEETLPPASIVVDRNYLGQNIYIDITPTTLFKQGDYADDVQKLLAIYKENIRKEKNIAPISEVSLSKPAARTPSIDPDLNTIECNYYVGPYGNLADVMNITRYNAKGKVIVGFEDAIYLWLMSFVSDGVRILTEKGVANSTSKQEFYNGFAYLFEVTNLGYRYLPVINN